MSNRKRTFAGFSHALQAQGLAMQWALACHGIRVGVEKPVQAGKLTTL